MLFTQKEKNKQNKKNNKLLSCLFDCVKIHHRWFLRQRYM